MSKTEIIGKKVLVNHPSESVYDALSDLSKLINRLPAEHRDKVRGDCDTLVMQAQGMELGIRVAERRPYSCIRFESFGANQMLPFTVWMHIGSLEAGTSSLHIELHAELNMMMKMMIGSKLQEGVDTITDQIAAGLNGQMPSDMSSQTPIGIGGTL